MAFTPFNPLSGGPQGDPLSGLIAQEQGQSDILNQGYQNFLGNRSLQQGQQQFEAGLAEKARERQHEMTSLRFGAEQSAYENQARRAFETEQGRLDREAREAERKSMQEFEMRKFGMEQKLSLSIARLNAMKEQAIASGQAQAAADYDKEIATLENDRAKNAMQLAIAQKAFESGATNLNTINAEFRKTLQQKINQMEQANRMGNEFAPSVVQSILDQSADLSSTALAGLAAQEEGSLRSTMMAQGPAVAAVQYFISQGLNEEQARVAARQLSGLQYLQLRPGATIFSGADFARQASAGFVAGTKTADEIATINRSMLGTALVNSLENLPPSVRIDSNSARSAIDMLLAGGGQQQEQALTALAQSGVSPDILDTMLNQVSMNLMDEQRKIDDRLAVEFSRDPEESLASRALSAQKEGLKDLASQARKARQSLSVTNVDSLRNAMLGLEVAKEGGEIGELLGAEMRAGGIDVDRLRGAFGKQKSALGEIEGLTRSQDEMDRKIRDAERRGTRRMTIDPAAAAADAELRGLTQLENELRGLVGGG